MAVWCIVWIGPYRRPFPIQWLQSKDVGFSLWAAVQCLDHEKQHRCLWGTGLVLWRSVVVQYIIGQFKSLKHCSFASISLRCKNAFCNAQAASSIPSRNGLQNISCIPRVWPLILQRTTSPSCTTNAPNRGRLTVMNTGPDTMVCTPDGPRCLAPLTPAEGLA